MFSQESLLSIEELDATEITHLLAVAKAFSQELETQHQIPLLAGKTIVQLFAENSTRTKMSFDHAIRKLGAQAMPFSFESSSQSKGESLLDTAWTIQAMKPHCLIVRHSSAGSPQFLARHLEIPVINAGDGFHEHPTQALLDAYTIQENIGEIEGKHVLIIGDIAHSRVARSNIHLLLKLGAKVSVSAPPTLLPPQPEHLGVQVARRPEDALPSADVVMTLRIQFERQNKMQLPGVEEYFRFWGLTQERVALAKKGAIFLDPGPINREVQIESSVADGTRSFILDQVKNGIYIRMSVLANLCAKEKLSEWLRKGTHVV